MDGIATIMRNGEVAGVGLLIDTDLVITCAHVVNTSLSLSKESQPKPVGKGVVQVRFPFISKKKSLRCEIVFWNPMPTSQNPTIDIAVLKITDDLSISPKVSKLNLVENYEERQVKFFGFPKNFENGSWATGKVDGRIADRRYQVSGNENPFAIEVEPRFSGSPVIDKKTGEIIGILQSKRLEIDKRIYYILPTIAIMEKYNQIGKYIVQSTQTDALIKRAWSAFQETVKYTLKSSLSGVPAAALFYYLERRQTISDLSTFELNDIFSPYFEELKGHNGERSLTNLDDVDVDDFIADDPDESDMDEFDYLDWFS